MIRTVTVGLDGSPESRAAAEWAAREALRRELPLRLLNAWETTAYPVLPQDDERTYRYWAERLPREAAESLRSRHPRLEISYEQRTGAPAEVLADAAARSELLVIGSRGLGSVAGFFIGSVAQATVARAECPVVLVRPGNVLAEPPAPDVVLGLDLDDAAEELLAFAFDTAARHEAPLRVVHCWRVPPVYGFSPSTIAPGVAAIMAEDANRALADALAPWRSKYPGVVVREQAVMGRPARQLVKAGYDASLVIVGRRIRASRAGARIGPVTHALMHHAVAPLAVVPHA
ncbi:universal stress protein [Streptomyces sp. DSM 44917]|uniref:Universal stress protein n=1 Tax=Streptomyces boetiae TaxID=3075541 RepID=A0ABU2LDZ7_9ACTN|nr:universal stress protein [Streptomyces sp. DSM 44917]MDT0309781.1 universal stress protein [Streptomyces sp. DSM 44917]